MQKPAELLISRSIVYWHELLDKICLIQNHWFALASYKFRALSFKFLVRYGVSVGYALCSFDFAPFHQLSYSATNYFRRWLLVVSTQECERW